MKIELIFRTHDVAVRTPGKNRFYFQELPNNKILDGLYIIGDQNINRFIERRMGIDESVKFVYVVPFLYNIHIETFFKTN